MIVQTLSRLTGKNLLQHTFEKEARSLIRLGFSIVPRPKMLRQTDTMEEVWKYLKEG